MNIFRFHQIQPGAVQDLIRLRADTLVVYGADTLVVYGAYGGKSSNATKIGETINAYAEISWGNFNIYKLSAETTAPSSCCVRC